MGSCPPTSPPPASCLARAFTGWCPACFGTARRRTKREDRHSVDVSSALYVFTRTYAGVADRSAQGSAFFAYHADEEHAPIRNSIGHRGSPGPTSRRGAKEAGTDRRRDALLCDVGVAGDRLTRIIQTPRSKAAAQGHPARWSWNSDLGRPRRHTAPLPPPGEVTATGCPTGQPEGWGTGIGRGARRRSHTRRYRPRCGQPDDSRTTIRRVRTTTSAATLITAGYARCRGEHLAVHRRDPLPQQGPARLRSARPAAARRPR